MNNKNYYEILLAGEVNNKRFMRFEISEINVLNGQTQLKGYFDDSGLFSFLKSIRDLHLKILKMELINKK